MENLPIPIENNHPIWEALKEIQQSRSDFSLENFVVGQHDTPEQKYRQTLLELQELLYTVRKVDLSVKKTMIEIENLKATGNPIDEIDAQIKELDLEKTHLARIGALKEIKTLIAIWNSFEHKYTAEEIEANQVQYWDARLTRQAHLEAIGSNGVVAWGSLDALRQIGKLKLTEDTEFDDSLKELK